MFYESKHSLEPEYCRTESGSDFSYPPHIHSCFEVIVITEGEMEVTVGDSTRLLKKGEAAFIFPNLIHGMRTPEKSSHRLIIFSGKLINHYSKKNQSSIPTDPFFRLNENASFLFSSFKGDEDVCFKKSVLYYLSGLFDRTASYVSVESAPNASLLYSILKYIEDNYNGECNLKLLSETLKYDYAYLSKYFIKNIKMPFNEYVNRRRISEVCHLLKTTDRSVLDISAECGYGSLRSLNRNFREIMGLTPADYRRSSFGS